MADPSPLSIIMVRDGGNAALYAQRVAELEAGLDIVAYANECMRDRMEALIARQTINDAMIERACEAFGYSMREMYGVGTVHTEAVRAALIAALEEGG